MSVPGRETFAEHVRRRGESRKALQEGRDAITDRIRAFADVKRSSPNQRQMQEFDREAARLDQRQAALDQGSRGTPVAALKGNDLLNARLRAAFWHEDLDEDDRGATEA